MTERRSTRRRQATARQATRRSRRLPLWGLGALLLVVGSTAASPPAAPVPAAPPGDWWNTSYWYRQKVTVTANSSALPAGYSVALTFNHQTLVGASKSRSDGDDVRVVYWNGGGWVELDRVLDPDSSWNSPTTTIWFKLQAGVAASGSDDNYYIYYGDLTATNPPANGFNVFLHYDDFESGDLNAWDNVWAFGPGDYIEASTDQPYHGSYSLKASVDTVGPDGQATLIDEVDVPQLRLTQRARVYIPSGFFTGDHIALLQFVDDASVWQNIVALSINTDSTLYIWNEVAGQAYGYTTTSKLTLDTWHTLEMEVVISPTSGEVRSWRDGVLDIEATGINTGSGPNTKSGLGIYWSTPRDDPNVIYFDDVYGRITVADPESSGPGTEEVYDPAVLSALAEIDPNGVYTSSTGNAFAYDIAAEISGIATGVNRITVTVPSNFGDPTVTDVLVGGSSVSYTDNTAGKVISVDLDTKVTSSDNIRILFTADAPTTANPSGDDFLSTVDDTASATPAQSPSEGDGDGDAGDNNDWTVTTTDQTWSLLGRYWFNEAASGQTPTTVYDDQASPVNLTMTYDTGVEWTVNNGHRGLNGASGPHSGGAEGDATSTKYQTALDGASTASFVVVAEWTNSGASQAIAGFYTSGGSRIAHFGTLSNGALDIWFRTESQNDLRLRWGGTSFADGTRRVFHVVYDSDDPTPANRVRLYVNGVDQGAGTLGSGSWPALGEALDLSGSIAVAGLNEAGGYADGAQGTLFYYAVYDGELPPGEISTDATALAADDDNITPAVNVTPDGAGPVVEQPGTQNSYDFVIQNTSSILDDYDLFASTDPASSFITVDSITFNGSSFTAPPDSARITELAAGASDTITVWYTVASDTDGNVDSLYVTGRSVSDTSATDDGFVEIEFDEPLLTPLVRYWIDEAPSGQSPTQLLDAEASPINMPLTYVDSVPYFDGDHGGFRNLRFNGADGDDTGGGIVDVGGTKIDAVDGATSATIEAKYMFEPGACSGSDERIFGISEDRGSTVGQLQIRSVTGGHTIAVMWNGDASVSRYAINGGGCGLTSASVVHWIVDTNQPTQEDRIRAYVGGARQTLTVQAGAWPSQGATIDLGAVGTRKMYIGRAYNNTPSPATLKGRIWYVALYSGAMNDAQITSNASTLAASDDNHNYAVNVTPDGAAVLRQAGSYSFEYSLVSGSSVLEDFDLLATTGPASSFITVDSITGGGIAVSGAPDSARITGVAVGADSTVTVWYSVTSSTDGRVDTLFLRGRSVSDTSKSNSGWLEVEFEAVSLSVTPDGVDTLQLLPSGSSGPTSYKFTLANTSAVAEAFDLLAFPGDASTFLSVDSVTGPNLSGGSPGDSARTGDIAGGSADSAFVWFTVSVGPPGALDSLYLMGRSVSQPSAADSGWLFVQLLRPQVSIGHSVNPGGMPPPGTDLTYTVTIANIGNYDASGVAFVNALGGPIEFKVSSVVNNLPVGVNVEYSNDNGSSWTYTPISGGCGATANYDDCVTHIRWSLQNDLSYQAPNNSGDVQYTARIQ